MIHDPFLDPPRRYRGCALALLIVLGNALVIGALVWVVLSGAVDLLVAATFAAVVVLHVLYRRRPRPPTPAQRFPEWPPNPPPTASWTVPGLELDEEISA